MKNLSEISEEIQKCLHDIHTELAKHNFRKKSKAYKEQIELNIINDMAKKHGLKYANIKMIYYGKAA